MDKTCNNKKRNGFLAWMGGISLCCSLVGISILVPVVAAIDEQNGYYGLPVFPIFLVYGIVILIIAIIGVALGVKAGEGGGTCVWIPVYALYFAVIFVLCVVLGPVNPGGPREFNKAWTW